MSPQESQTVFMQHFGKENSRSLDYYLAEMHGYVAFKNVLSRSSDEVIDQVKRSGLCGRGGAGFSTGTKWGFIPKESARPKYLVCNADESEPGTFKDRELLRSVPHALIEGMLIAGYAINSKVGYIYIRGEYVREAALLQEALQEAYSRGWLGKNIQNSGFDFDIVVHRGAGAYVCGEETALLNSLVGRRGEPRVKPPFPARVGAFGEPTVVNNVETLAYIPAVIRGSESVSLTRLVGISGHVNRPGLYELPLGKVTIRQLIYDYAEGILDDRNLKAVIPGGSSSPVLTADQIDLVYDVDSLSQAGSMLGSAALIVVSEDYCVVRLLRRMIRFYAHESCGQCTPCREGVHWMENILDRIEKGRGRDDDLPLLLDIAENIDKKTLCPLGDAAAGPVLSFVKKFRADFEAHIRGGRCPSA